MQIEVKDWMVNVLAFAIASILYWNRDKRLNQESIRFWLDVVRIGFWYFWARFVMIFVLALFALFGSAS